MSVLVIILPILLITLLLIIFGIICLWKRRKSKAEKSREAECEEKLPLLQRHEILIESEKIEKYLNGDVFVNTEKYEEAIGVFETKGWVTLVGPPGSGKTMTAIKLGRDNSASGNKSIPFCQNIHDVPKFVNEKEEPCIIMDNLIEHSYMNHSSKLLQDISTFNDVFDKYIKNGLVHVIITIGKEAWNELKDFLGSHIELFKSGIVEGIGERFNEDETESMIAHHLRINKNNEKTSTVNNIVININVDSIFSLPISIDLLCANRTLLGEQKDSKPVKFKYRMEMYLKNWRDSDDEVDKKSFCFVFFVALCGGILSMDDFESDSKKHIYINVCKAFNVEPYARNEIESMISMEGNRRVPGFLYLMSETPNRTYGFHHESLLDFFLATLCKDEHQPLFIENANIAYIMRKCKLSNYYYESSLSYVRKILKYWHLEDRLEIQDNHIGKLLDRIIREIKQGTMTLDWKDHIFMEHVSFKREWRKK
ncbi:uncharacterized protein LOC134268779 [Saccostrea cucullata]|uniref:uncharacterized protein LOC134268779 n=1 Tax=Saccostrea cuccullata TaxID=36930 RepID=UPI002ED2B827